MQPLSYLIGVGIIALAIIVFILIPVGVKQERAERYEDFVKVCEIRKGTIHKLNRSTMCYVDGETIYFK